jgi:hypothetical protein
VCCVCSNLVQGGHDLAAQQPPVVRLSYGQKFVDFRAEHEFSVRLIVAAIVVAVVGYVMV